MALNVAVSLYDAKTGHRRCIGACSRHQNQSPHGEEDEVSGAGAEAGSGDIGVDGQLRVDELNRLAERRHGDDVRPIASADRHGGDLLLDEFVRVECRRNGGFGLSGSGVGRGGCENDGWSGWGVVAEDVAGESDAREERRRQEEKQAALPAMGACGEVDHGNRGLFSVFAGECERFHAPPFIALRTGA